MSTYYYVYPFGENADDLVEIPTSAADDGSVSYYAGYTDPYEYDLLTNPNALPISRGSFNQLMFQITSNIQQLQQYGTPPWITAADNLGDSFEYPIYARVYYGGEVYENQVADNTATPGVDDTWLIISAPSSSFQAGMVMDWAGPTAPTDWAIATGQALSRSTYAELYANLTQTQMGTLTNGSAVITGLTSTTGMSEGMDIEAIGIPSGTTIDSIDSGTQITMSQNATASGSEGVIFYYWGNGDGSTTFNVPNLQTQSTAGAGGSGYTFGSGLGQSGGAQDQTITRDMMPAHTHDFPPDSGVTGFTVHKPGGGTDLDAGATYGVSNSLVTGGITGYTGPDTLPIIPPTTLMYKIIRLV